MTNKTTRIADGWTGNKGGYLKIDPSNDGTLSWVVRCAADGTVRDYIGPFKTPHAARSAAAKLAEVA